MLHKKNHHIVEQDDTCRQSYLVEKYYTNKSFNINRGMVSSIWDRHEILTDLLWAVVFSDFRWAIYLSVCCLTSAPGGRDMEVFI